MQNPAAGPSSVCWLLYAPRSVRSATTHTGINPDSDSVAVSRFSRAAASHLARNSLATAAATLAILWRF